VLPLDLGVSCSFSAEANPHLNNSLTAAVLGIRAWNRNWSIAATLSVGRMSCRRTAKKERLFAAIKEAQEEIEQHGAEASGSIDFDGS
jgi:hypothetical protein